MTPPLPILRVLGTPALHGPDGEPMAFRVRKHFALLIYLALEPQLHRREKLAALLWPRATTSEARHSLSTALSVLRARLGRDKVETTRDAARLVPGSLELDLDRLARGEIHATDTMAALDIAPLLHDFPVSDATPWEQWRDGLAAKWQPTIRDALLARIDRTRRQGNTRAMEVVADALLMMDDLSEDGIRAKMESRAFAGDRLTALQIYEDWRVRLADELGAQPSDLVAGMALRLRRRGWERTSGEHIPSVRTDQWKDRPFVGRAKEYEVLYEGWEGCERGTLKHVLITGESGVGKSTLMERLTTAAGLQGATAARVQCHAVEREIPYGAIGSLIGFLLDRPGASAVSPEWLSELSRTVSAVRRRFPNVATPPEATGEMVRIRLADAFHELVRAIAEEQPLILVMDDIHLGDDASVAVMHLLLRRLTNERVLVLCTLRQGDEPLAPSARGMLERAELAQMEVLPLPPLTEAESTELLGQLVPAEIAPPPATVRRALLRAGSGLPMLLELLVRDWMTHGDRCVALAVQAMTEEPGTAGGAGETYRRLLERLTLGLDPNTRSVLNLAAILGSQLNEFELYSLVDLTLAQAMTGLSQLAASRIMRDSGHGLEFVNEVMRGEVYLAVPSSVRKVLHSKVADRLIQRSKEGEEMLGLAIAWHCMRSGRVQEAGEWLVIGGEEALARSALAEAEEALESGYANLPKPFRERIGIALSDVLFDQSRFQDAHTLVLTLYTSDATQNPRLAQTSKLIALALRVGLHSQQAQVLADLLTIVRQDGPSPFRLRAASLCAASVALSQDQQQLADALAALDCLRSSPLTQPQVARCDLLRAQIFYWQRRIDESEELLVSLEGSAAHNGPALHTFNLQLGRGACRASRGDYEASIRFAARAGEIAAKEGNQSKEAQADGNRAIGLFRLGRFKEALEAADKARRLAGPHDYSTTGTIGFGLALCCLAESDPDQRFYTLLEEARTLASRDLSVPVGALLRLWVGDALWRKGEYAIARETAREALDRLEVTIWPWMGVACRWAARFAVTGINDKYQRLIRLGVEGIRQLDTIDQYEVALVARAMLELDPKEEADLVTVGNEARLRLPPQAIAMAHRQIQPTHGGGGLAQHAHPTT